MSMKKYPSIRYPSEPETDGLLDGDKIVVMEKLDGANFRFKFDEDGNLMVGSRNVVYKDAHDENLDKSFRHAVEYIENEFSDFTAAEKAALQDYTFYGESMHQHTINYDTFDGTNPDPIDDDMPNVLIFDIVEDGKFIEHGTFIDIMKDTPLHVAPILRVIDVDDFYGYEIPKSAYRVGDEDADNEFDRNGLAEGLVFKRYDGMVRAKKVHPQFKERHGGPSGSDDDSTAKNKAGIFIDRYVTEARIEKVARKIEERPDSEYDGLQMDMMKDLPREVLIDAMEENAWELLNNDFAFEMNEDFKEEVRSQASKKCARTLKEMCQSF